MDMSIFQNVTYSNELWVIHLAKVRLYGGLVKVWMKNAGEKTTLENLDTLHVCVFEGYKGGSASIGTRPLY